MSNNPSLSARRNLWKSKTLEQKYERELRKLFSLYGSAAVQLLQDSTIINPDGSTTLDVSAFNRGLEELARRHIKQPGEAITEKHARAAFDLGQGHADTDYEKQVKNDRSAYLH
jgi:hypothetical protein